MLCLLPKFFSVDYINSCPFITGGCTECLQILSKPTVGMPVRTTGLPLWQKPLQTVKLHQCMVLPAPHLDMGHCTVCRNTFVLWSFNILGGFEGFSNYQVSCHDKHNQPTKSCLRDTPLLPEMQQYSPVSFHRIRSWTCGIWNKAVKIGIASEWNHCFASFSAAWLLFESRHLFSYLLGCVWSK